MTAECVNASTCPPGTEHPHPVDAGEASHCFECSGPYPCAEHPEAVGTPTPVERADVGDMATPEPVLAGKFAIYEDGKGGFVLFTDTGDGPQQKHIPAALVKMATGGGMMGRRLAGLFG